LQRPANANLVEHRGHVSTGVSRIVVGEESDSVAVGDYWCLCAKSGRTFLSNMDRLLVEFRICALRSVARRKHWQDGELQSLEVRLL
jgi:uncharacterized ferritin-like protein (DUF455 family)